MIYLMPKSVKVSAEGVDRLTRVIEQPIVAMAQAMAETTDTFWRLDEEQLRDWLPVFELTEPAPIILTGFLNAIVSPIWNAVPTTLTRRDVEVALEERRVQREAQQTKEAPISDAPDALKKRAGGGHRREPELQVVHTEDEVD